MIWALKFLWYFWTTILTLPLAIFPWWRELPSRQWEKCGEL